MKQPVTLVKNQFPRATRAEQRRKKYSNYDSSKLLARPGDINRAIFFKFPVHPPIVPLRPTMGRAGRASYPATRMSELAKGRP